MAGTMFLSSAILLVFFLILTVATNEVAVLRRLQTDFPEWEPRGILDVGANEGGWSQQAHEIFPSSRLFLVEAFEQHNQTLSNIVKEIGDTSATYRIAVLSNQDGNVVKFYHSDQGQITTGNSIFQENTHAYSKAQYTELTTHTLNSLLENAQEPFSDASTYDYLKLDVQGAELVVLQGASQILHQVTFVQLEVSLIQYNQGAACWWQIDDLLRNFGFYLYDLDDLQRRPDLFHTKGTGQMDVLYVRPTAQALPEWLKTNKVNMCGSTETSNNGSSFTNSEKCMSIQQKETPTSLTVLSSWPLPLFLGFLVGKKWPGKNLFLPKLM